MRGCIALADPGRGRIPGFFGSGRVIALDGLVSRSARLYWTRRRFEHYLAYQNVRYVADEQRAMNRAMLFVHERPALEIVASYPLRGWPTHRRILWKVARTN